MAIQPVGGWIGVRRFRAWVGCAPSGRNWIGVVSPRALPWSWFGSGPLARPYGPPMGAGDGIGRGHGNARRACPNPARGNAPGNVVSFNAFALKGRSNRLGLGWRGTRRNGQISGDSGVSSGSRCPPPDESWVGITVRSGAAPCANQSKKSAAPRGDKEKEGQRTEGKRGHRPAPPAATTTQRKPTLSLR